MFFRFQFVLGSGTWLVGSQQVALSRGCCLLTLAPAEREGHSAY